MKITTSSLLIALAFFWPVLLPKAHAVNPPPDGGYPGLNTAEGTNALKNLTTGAGNTALGWFSLFSNTDGSFNTAIGAGTLVLNVGNQSTGDGVDNTAVGAVALFLNIAGSDNTAVGTAALLRNDGDTNTGVGAFALNSNTTGNFNTASGAHALAFNTEGDANTANGVFALERNTTGDDNTAVGANALLFNTEGGANTATGAFALERNTIGIDNTAVGAAALSDNDEGSVNTAIGRSALNFNTTGGSNTAVGVNALRNNVTGSGNIAVGVSAGSELTEGNNNIEIGNVGVADESGTIRIGNNAMFFGQTRAFIAGIFGTNVTGSTVVVNSDGQLGVAASSRRYKKEIKAMEQASEAILALKPVTFHYKSDKTGTSQFGLIAEEVAEVNPDLVVCDANGEIYTVRYDAVNAMLLNEFLKEHRKVEDQQKEIASLKAELKEQRELIQKVSDKLEITKPGRRMVAENP